MMQNFREKGKGNGCHTKHMEPYSSWQSAAEGAIREVKQGSGRKMTASQAPHKLLDHLLEAFIRSHTALTSLNCRAKYQKRSCQDKQHTFRHLWNVDGRSLWDGMTQRLNSWNLEKVWKVVRTHSQYRASTMANIFKANGQIIHLPLSNC